MHILKAFVEVKYDFRFSSIFGVILLLLKAINVLAMDNIIVGEKVILKNNIFTALSNGDVTNMETYIKADDSILIDKINGKTLGEVARSFGFLSLSDRLDTLARKKRRSLERQASQKAVRKSLSIKKARDFIRKNKPLGNKEALRHDCVHVIKKKTKFFFEVSRGNIGWIEKFLERQKIIGVENADYLLFANDQGKTASFIAEENGFLVLAGALLNNEQWMKADKIKIKSETKKIVREKIKFFTQYKNITEVIHLLTCEMAKEIYFKRKDIYNEMLTNFNEYFLAEALNRKFWANEEAWGWLNLKMLAEKIDDHQRPEIANDTDITAQLLLALEKFDIVVANSLIVNGADLTKDENDQKLKELKKTVLLHYALQDYCSWIMYYRPEFQEKLEKENVQQ